MTREFAKVEQRTRALAALERLHASPTEPGERPPGWEPAVPLAERIAWALLFIGLAWVAAFARDGGPDLLAVIFASVWTALVGGGCAWGIVRDTRDGAKW